VLTPLNIVALLVVVPAALVLLVGVPAACWQSARVRRADRAHRVAGEAAARAFTAGLAREGR
jgi:hypothetical protein